VTLVAQVVELEIPPRRDHLALVRVVVTTAARQTSTLPERRIDDLRLAVSEGCANAFDAQAAAGQAQPVLIRVESTAEHLTVTIVDHAGGFEPAEVEAIPSATDPGRLRHERGLGIPIMESLVDEVTFTRTDDGTALRLLLRT
jgi:anti-sigma regulatory factor (Ser/Thr protein kinase)